MHLFIEDELSPRNYVKKIDAPVLLVHGTDDSTVPISHSRVLCKALENRCLLWEIPSSGHMSLFQTPNMRKRLMEYVRAPL